MWLIVVVLTFIAGIGAFAERIFGHGRWLLLYLLCAWLSVLFGVLLFVAPPHGHHGSSASSWSWSA